MNNRRQFLREVAETFALLSFVPLIGCGKEEANALLVTRRFSASGATIDMYDTNAMALYYDGTLGPKTGIIQVQYLLDNVEITLPFWHGHGGKKHEFKLTPATFKELKALKKVTLETTEVESHKHTLFIDFSDKRYRVAGAKPIPVPV